MSGELTLYGAKGSGSVAVEAALSLLGIPFRLVEAAPWGDADEQARLAAVSPLGQVPVLDLPSGERMTESAAILIWLADAHPQAGLSPAADAPERAAFLRWMVFIPAAIYPMHTIRDHPGRWVDGEEPQKRLDERAVERLRACWRIMEGEVAPAPHLAGARLTVLDLYAAVVSRWAPRREFIEAECPKIARAVKRVDDDPRLERLWAERFGA